ncbi:MAG: hypothetical protein IJR59_06955 [Firmicutes bacterium]|nr:hypothetical protein [Bacillota bacterium]
MNKKSVAVTMTLRLHKDSIVPHGCRAIPYEERYGYCTVSVQMLPS